MYTTSFWDISQVSDNYTEDTEQTSPDHDETTLHDLAPSPSANE